MRGCSTSGAALASFSGTIRSRILAYSGGLRQTWLKQYMYSKRVSVVSAEPPSAHAGAAIKADYKSNFDTLLFSVSQENGGWFSTGKT